jgi:hypothetical protein
MNGQRDAYMEFLARRAVVAPLRGIESPPMPPDHLFPYQGACATFGLRAGSWACWLGTGLGKTRVELWWGQEAARLSNGYALILTPLAVARQIEAEGKSLGYDVRVIRSQDDARPGVNVCNYDRLDKLDPQAFGAVALNESSILKSFTGATSRALIEAFAGHRWRLSASATPAPNDHTELAQHSAFCGVLTREEMLVRWFVNDSAGTGTWRLKGHAIRSFWDWVASWARAADHPRDLGDDVPGFDLPPFVVHRHRVGEAAAKPLPGMLFADAAVSATDMHRVKRQTAGARAAIVADLVWGDRAEPWLVWCDTNYEADALLDVIGDAPGGTVEVRGSHSIEAKEDAVAAFLDGSARILIAKPSSCGYGLNLQHCARMAFVGRSFSYETYHQAVRRCWRFGQLRQVEVHLVVAEGEDHIGRVVDRKADENSRMRREMAEAMKRALGTTREQRRLYEPRHQGRLPAWL